MRFLFVLFLFVSLQSSAQWKSFIISVHGDTLNRVDMKDRKQGPWVIHQDEVRGEQGYDEQGYFVDDKRDGVWVRFSLEGDKLAAENYRWGVLDGKSQYFTRTGGLIREESWRAVDPTKTFDTVDVVDVNDPTKVVDHVVVKLEGQTYKHGTWTYYDPEWGTVEKTEKYFLGKQKAEDGSDINDDIKPLDRAYNPKTDSLGNKAVSKPKTVLDYEKKNAGKKKINVRNGQTGY
jgi:hypothetical protein